MKTALELFKLDLGVTHNLRDGYFTAHLDACKAELAGKGVHLDVEKTEDIKLLSDYAAWEYRHRTENIPMSQNLQWRINNRKLASRAAKGAKNDVSETP